MIHRDIKSNLVPVSDVPGLSAQLGKKLLNHGIQHLFPGNDRMCLSVHSAAVIESRPLSFHLLLMLVHVCHVTLCYSLY